MWWAPPAKSMPKGYRRTRVATYSHPGINKRYKKARQMAKSNARGLAIKERFKGYLAKDCGIIRWAA